MNLNRIAGKNRKETERMLSGGKYDAGITHITTIGTEGDVRLPSLSDLEFFAGPGYKNYWR